MNIQPMMLGVNAPHMSPNQNTQKANTKRDDAFSSVLSKTQDKQGNPENDKVKNDKNSLQTKSDSIEDTASTAPKDISTSTPAEEVSKLEKDSLEDSILAEEAIIEEIANLLQITPEELEQLLATMQIGVLDLLQMDNLQQLIMQVHNVDEPMDLLLIPEVASDIKMITSILEEHAVNNLVSIPGEIQPEEQLEIKVDENILNVNANSEKSIQTNAKIDSDSKVLDENNKVLDTGQGSTSKVSEPVDNNEKLSQNEEQSTSNQNTSANQFLDTLSQSMGEAFQLQSEQVGEVNETILGRHEVANPRMILDQIVERIKVSVIEEEAQMNIQLKPEHLGKLSMEVISKQGAMTAHFTVENERVKALIEQNIQDLKDVLESKGLIIEQLEVTVGQNQQENEQTHKNSRSSKNISDIINSIMNEDILEEELNIEKRHVNESSEVDFIA